MAGVNPGEWFGCLNTNSRCYLICPHNFTDCPLSRPQRQTERINATATSETIGNNIYREQSWHCFSPEGVSPFTECQHMKGWFLPFIYFRQRLCAFCVHFVVVKQTNVLAYKILLIMCYEFTMTMNIL